MRIKLSRRRLVGRVLAGAAIVVLIGLMLANTRFVSTETSVSIVGQKFSANQYANENYDAVAAAVLERATPATGLLEAFEADYDAAGEAFGGRDGKQSAWAFSVALTGVAGEVDTVNGQLPLKVDGLPDSIAVLVQTGPPIIGPALRNVTGEITFGMFTNQTEFQSVAVELNNRVRETVLAGVDATTLKDKTISVVGVFAGDAWNSRWLITPVQIEVDGQ
jgi:predicted lipoprotein